MLLRMCMRAEVALMVINDYLRVGQSSLLNAVPSLTIVAFHCMQPEPHKKTVKIEYFSRCNVTFQFIGRESVCALLCTPLANEIVIDFLVLVACNCMHEVV